MSSLASPRVPVTVRTEGDAVVLALADDLDAATGRALVSAVATAVAAGPQRVDIDLTAITRWTDEGATSLVRCRALCRELPEGLHYRTGRGPGRDALLAAYR